jgi:hypothetical protein
VRTLPAILSVELADNEIVEWTWTRWPEGWVVTGYRIVTLPSPPPADLTLASPQTV